MHYLQNTGVLYTYLSTNTIIRLFYVAQAHWVIFLCNVVVSHTYHQTYSWRRTKSQHLNVSRLVLQLSLPNPLVSGVKSRMKM